MSFVDFNYKLMDKFEIVSEIVKIIYDHSSEGKFIYNEFTQKMQLSPLWLNKINQYNSLKQLVFNTANLNTGMLNLTLLKSLIEQVWYKQSIYKI